MVARLTGAPFTKSLDSAKSRRLAEAWAKEKKRSGGCVSIEKFRSQSSRWAGYKNIFCVFVDTRSVDAI